MFVEGLYMSTPYGLQITDCVIPVSFVIFLSSR